MTEPPHGWSTPGPAPGEPTGAGPEAPSGYRPWTAAPGVVPLRPLALGELLDGAIKIVRRSPRPTLGLSAAIAVVVTVLNVLFVLAFDGGTSTTSGLDVSFSEQVSTGAGSAAPGGIVSYLAGLVLTGALVAVVGKAVLGRPAPTREVWDTVRPRLWALLGLSLLSGLIVVAPVAVGVGIAVVLGLAAGGAGVFVGVLLALGGAGLSAYLYVRLALAAPALVLEKAGVVTSLRRSGILVRGSWWRMFGILLITLVLTGMLTAIISLPISLVTLAVSGGKSEGTAFLVAQQVAAGLASVLVAPFAAGVRALLYVDRRMRAEGLDVALQAAASSPVPSA
jgi:hypothetical protein